jgi:hypothetical protein
MDVYINILLISALVGVGWSVSRPGRFTLWEGVPGIHWIGAWVGPRTGLNYVEKRNILTLLRFEVRPLGRPARSQSLCRLCSPGFQPMHDARQKQKSGLWIVMSRENDRELLSLSLWFSLCLYGSTALLDLSRFFSSLILYSLSQSRYLYTEQLKQKIRAHRNPCLEWNSNPRSQCLSGRRQFMPQTERPVWPAHVVASHILLML